MMADTKKPTDVLEIVEHWLKTNDYDGLFYPGECGCLVGELEPCGEINAGCEPGYKTEGCRDGYGMGEHDFHIVRDKPNSQKAAEAMPDEREERGA